MNFDLELKDVGDLLTGLAAAIGIFITIRLNFRGTRAHAIASQAAALAQNFDVQVGRETDDRRRLVAKGLRDRLIDRSHEATERYLLQTEPKKWTFFEIVGSIIILLLLISVFWFRLDAGEWQLLRAVVAWAALVLAVLFLGLGIWMSILTSRPVVAEPSTDEDAEPSSSPGTPAGHESSSEPSQESHAPRS